LYHDRILDVGPQFKITSQIDAKVALTDIEASVDVKYDLSGVSFVFPPQDSSQAGSFTPGANRESSCPSFPSLPHPANGSTETGPG
jgi:hypothetical protein